MVPTREIEREVLALVPQEQKALGITVSVKKPPPEIPGYEVWLHPDQDSQLVGRKALFETLADWHASQTGMLPAMVRQAARALARRVSPGEVGSQG